MYYLKILKMKKVDTKLIKWFVRIYFKEFCQKNININ